MSRLRKRGIESALEYLHLLREEAARARAPSVHELPKAAGSDSDRIEHVVLNFASRGLAKVLLTGAKHAGLALIALAVGWAVHDCRGVQRMPLPAAAAQAR